MGNNKGMGGAGPNILIRQRPFVIYEAGEGGSGGHLGIICDHLGIIWESFGSEVGVNLELKPTRMTYSFFCLLLCGETTAGPQ
jgi:hypothetical protein